MIGDSQLFIHAHPDDESLFTGHIISQLLAQGHRVSILSLTNGELREPNRANRLRKPKKIPTVREIELDCAAKVMGARRSPSLGIRGTRDSGMRIDSNGKPQRSRLINPLSLTYRNAGRAAEIYAEQLKGERITDLISYDSFGGYGHPDHIWANKFTAYLFDILRADVRPIGLWEITENAEIADAEFAWNLLSKKEEALRCHTSQVIMHGQGPQATFIAGGRPRKVCESEYLRLLRRN